MPCIGVILVLAFPRVVMILMFLFSHYLQRAYHMMIVPVLGFIFLPITTIVYAWLVNTHTPIAGGYLFALILAVVFDAGSFGGGWRHRGRN
jgi:VIT1/CCC1 family predicted Fe2+/Mn2+ transporter